MKVDLDKIVDVLSASKKVVIAGHVKPDGDAIGSCFALGLGLKKMGKEPIVLLESCNDKYSIIEGKEFLYDGNLDDLVDFDVFVSLDTSTPARLGFTEAVLKRAPISICVDHHLVSEKFCDLNYIDSNSSSTSELMYDILAKLVMLDTKIATALYAGMVYDTNGFCHNSTTRETHYRAGTLLDFKINFNEIYNEFFYMHTIIEAKIFAVAINNLEILADYPVAYTFVTKEEMEKLGAKAQDTDGIASYVLNTRGIEVGLFVYPLPGEGMKVALRSKGIDIRVIAERFGGGGHKLAAGANIESDNIEEVVSKVLEEIKKEIKLNNE